MPQRGEGCRGVKSRPVVAQLASRWKRFHLLTFVYVGEAKALRYYITASTLQCY